MSEEILKPISAMTNDELLSVLTVKRENFNDEHKEKVADELVKRGVNLEEKFKTAKYKLNLQDIEEVDVTEVYKKIFLLKNPLDVLTFINYMNELYVIQKNENAFVIHHHTQKYGFSSFFLDNEVELKSSLQNFFSLDNSNQINFLFPERSRNQD